MIKSSPSSKALVIRINLLFLAFFLIVYIDLILRPPTPASSVYSENAASFPRCSQRQCQQKVGSDENNKMKSQKSVKLIKREKPNFLNEMRKGMKIGMINMEHEDISEWSSFEQTTMIPIPFDHASQLFEWKHLFPEWIDEEEEMEGSSCPELPMPAPLNKHLTFDLIVAKLPCKYPKSGWNRDVSRLQVNLIAAKVAAERGKRDRKGKVKVVFLSRCRPMLELFRCDDMVSREMDWWFYQPKGTMLEEKMALPVGSCQLAMPLWEEEQVDRVYNLTKVRPRTRISSKREAYATVLHSTESYVCGAITLAQTLLQTGTTRDLIILIDNSISQPTRAALVKSGWQIRVIKRIRNPRAEKNSYNEYNYSKFRLWQLTDYDKVIFIDSDIIVLRSLDLLFHFPQMSAVGNDNSIFNSGIMVLEPSNCTFHHLMNRRKKIISYNGGDQGFLNEVFVWWHRLPRRVNFLKNFWANTTAEATVKNQLFASDPPKLYSIHYLGLKPWLCYRDYDCNWDIGDQRVYASDVAHRRWWRVYDAMDEELKGFCGLTKQRNVELKWDRKMARQSGLSGEHWRINVTDPRQFV
ncbi:hypothetical protein QQ045_025324 [Rhodiola kirilowii]